MALTEGIQESSREAARRAAEAARTAAEAERTTAEAARERVETEPVGVEAVGSPNEMARTQPAADPGSGVDPSTQAAAQTHAIRSSFPEAAPTDPWTTNWSLAASPAETAPQQVEPVASPQSSQPLDEALGELRQADAVLDAAEAASTPQEAIETLGEGYAAAAPEVQAHIRNDSRTGALLDTAVGEANAPLASIPNEIRSGHDVYPPVREALHNLEQLTEGLPPELAGGLVERALPAYESVQQASEGFGIVGGPNGQYSLVNIAGRVADAPGGTSLVGRLTNLNDNTLGLETALYDGAAPALFIEMERRGNVVMGASPLEVAMEGVEGYLDQQVQGDVERYAELTEELSFLVTNAGPAMTAEQLDRAIEEYIAAKGPEWEADVEATRQALEQHGENLLQQIEQLHDLPSELTDRQGEIDDNLRAMLEDPAAQTAISMALRQRPELAAGQAGQDLVDTFAELGVTGDDNPMAVSLVGAGLNATVAGGVSYAVFGSSAWAGPIGFGVAAAATLGLFVYDGIRSTQHSNRFQTEEATAFLADSEVFSDEVAQVLTDTSGESHSPVPILLEYSRLRGLNAEQTVDWINSIDPDRLAALRDNLHHTLDEIDGDLSRFGETHDDDEWFVRDTEQRPWFAATGESRPESATQVDAILEVLEIDLPRP